MTEKDTLLWRRSNAPDFERALRHLSVEYDCRVVESAEEARDILAHGTGVPVGIVWDRTDAEDSLAYCRAMHLSRPDMKIILIAGGDAHPRAIEAFNKDYLFRCLIAPVTPTSLRAAVRNAIRRFEMERVQNMLIQNAADIDRQIHATPHWRVRFRTSASGLVRTITGSVVLSVIVVGIILLAGISVFLLLYYVKSALGIDLFADVHLKDFLP